MVMGSSPVKCKMENLLFYIFLAPLFGILMLLVTPSNQKTILKIIALNFSYLPFIGSLILWGSFDKSIGTFQFVNKIFWLPILNLNLTLGLDGVSLFFLLLTALLIPLCLLISWNISVYLKEYLISFLILEFFLIGTFCVLDLLLFYVFFESVLIPMFLIIGIWGSRERKIVAAYYIFFYTLFGSVLMLLSVLYMYYQVGTTDYETLLAFSFSSAEQKIMWFTFFVAFASKIPMIPVHLWLPEAHVEAPTTGSVILAGILLKLGVYGFIRFSLPLFPEASFYFAPLVYTMASAGVVYASFTAIRQSDFKRIIAYTSIAHMNLVMIGIFSFNNLGIEGAILQSLSHGFVSSALFLIIGIVYERHHTRMVKYYGGLVHVMPIYIAIFLFFTMANIGFPGTSSFVGELLIIAGSLNVNTSVTFLGATGMVIGGGYALWLFNRVAYGNLKIQYCKDFLDLNLREFLVFVPLLVGTLAVGIYPGIFLSTLHMSVSAIVENMYF